VTEENPLDGLDRVEKQALEALEQVGDDAGLQAWKVRYLGRSSELMLAFGQLGRLSKELRPAVGQRANQVKQALEAGLAARGDALKAAALQRSLESERLDVTLPGREPLRGRLHPSTQMLREVCRIFADMGYQIYRTREVESDEYNFGLLNMPPYHPARDMWDTFHVTTPGVVLRTHTSPGQVRVMRERAPEPIRVVLPGMCYRYEQMSARSEIQFNQVEGLMVGRNVTFGDLKGSLDDFARRMFGTNVRTRLRPSYFPFTEPSGEMDIECFVCGGVGCPVCKYAGWLEILGCGMVHPVVLQNGGYDPEVYSGFAFGMGIERTSLLRYRIDDIRYYWGNDVRFLEQF
jgi:phenylalanyl-tRNA synthetase alpha chain